MNRVFTENEACSSILILHLNIELSSIYSLHTHQHQLSNRSHTAISSHLCHILIIIQSSTPSRKHTHTSLQTHPHPQPHPRTPTHTPIIQPIPHSHFFTPFSHPYLHPHIHSLTQTHPHCPPIIHPHTPTCSSTSDPRTLYLTTDDRVKPISVPSREKERERDCLSAAGSDFTRTFRFENQAYYHINKDKLIRNLTNKIF